MTGRVNLQEPPAARSSEPSGLLQRCGGTRCPPGTCGHAPPQSTLLRRVATRSGAVQVPPTVHEVLRSPGQPLEGTDRAAMESRFGYDFSQVRVHTGGPAASSARSLDALAYTLGSNIVFGQGRYAPATEAGRRLLAHELTHVIQQRTDPAHAGWGGGGLRIGDPHDILETEATRTADTVAGSGGASVQELSHIIEGHSASGVLRRNGPDDPSGAKPRSGGLTEGEWVKIRNARKFFNLPPSPTAGESTIVGVLIDKNGNEYPLKSGHEGGPYGGTQRGNIPRGRGEGFSSGAPTEKNIGTHIEGHAAAKMHELGLTEATLLSEEAPCRVCDVSQGWDPEKGRWTGKATSPHGTPAINTVLPPGSKLTIVDPDATGTYRSFRAGPPARPPLSTTEPVKPPSAGEPPAVKPGPTLGEGKTGLPKLPEGLAGGEGTTSKLKPPGAGEPPAVKPGPTLGEGALGKGELPKLPEGLGAAKGTGSRIPSARGIKGVGRTALAAAGNIAVELAALVTTVVWELVVVPKLEKIQSELTKLLEQLEADRRRRLEAQIKAKFDAVDAAHVGRIVKACYLGKLRELEKAGKQGYINITLNVSFEDTSNRIQLFEETPPESFFDLEFNDVELVDVQVGDAPVEASVGQMGRCESCGTFGRSRSFVGNNPLWEQKVQFSLEAPRASEIAKEFEAEPDIGACVSAAACFIATACYGSPLTAQVQVLRRFRDGWLMPNLPGRQFVHFYYTASPPFARWLVRHEWPRRLVREGVVAPLARLVEHLGLDQRDPMQGTAEPSGLSLDA
jgi:hypothetical protein